MSTGPEGSPAIERDAVTEVFSRLDEDTRSAVVEILRVERDRLHMHEVGDRDTITALTNAIAGVVT